MLKFTCRVYEDVTVRYPDVEIEAETEEEAHEIAEEMRAQGELGDPHSYSSVEDVNIYTCGYPVEVK
jgi:hypothetical protein